MLHFLWILVAAVFLLFVIGASSDDNDRDIKAALNFNKRNLDGSYFYEYYLNNGASQKVTGTLKDVNGEKVYSVEGSYSYRQEDGRIFTLNYIADENGFRILPFDKIDLLHPVVPPTPPTVVPQTPPTVVPARPHPYYEPPPPQATINPKSIASLLGG